MYSSVSGPLGCLHLLAIVNNAAMNVGVPVSFGFPAFSSFGYMYPEVELLDHMEILFLIF